MQWMVSVSCPRHCFPPSWGFGLSHLRVLVWLPVAANKTIKCFIFIIFLFLPNPSNLLRQVFEQELQLVHDDQDPSTVWRSVTGSDSPMLFFMEYVPNESSPIFWRVSATVLNLLYRTGVKNFSSLSIVPFHDHNLLLSYVVYHIHPLPQEESFEESI